jgi:ABC-type nitrate/sulfonate/bicarbonate transport system ATPase subunit
MPGEIVARGICKSFKNRHGSLSVIEGIDLEVGVGEIVALVGPSGCGKSTLLNILAGFEQADRGEILVDGKPVAGPNRKSILIPQHPSTFPWTTVRRNLTMVQKRLAPEKRDQRTNHYLNLVGLSAFADAFPWQLSGGMRQRVELARALVVRPEILYMDEPFGALDALTRIQIRGEFLRILFQERHTTLLVTHDVEEALHLADRIIILSDRPARIRCIVPVTFPHPRSRMRIEIGELKDDILRELGVDIDDDLEVRAQSNGVSGEEPHRRPVPKLRSSAIMTEHQES